MSEQLSTSSSEDVQECAYTGGWRAKCKEPAWAGSAKGYCIYHAEENGKEEETARAVWQEARRRVKAGQCDFAGWHFPWNPDGPSFKLLTFKVASSFDGATFHGGAEFSLATFKENAYFRGATLEGRAEFAGVTFGGDADFTDATFGGCIGGVTVFSHTLFEGKAMFVRTKFGGAFQDFTIFARPIFEGDADFTGATFQGGAHFDGASAKAGSTVDFPLPAWYVPLRKGRPFARRKDGEVPYRMAKQSARDRGDYRRAGAYHYAEQCAIEHGKREKSQWRVWKKGFWKWSHTAFPCWLEFIFARCLFGYGEKPTRVLIAGLLVILLWAGIFDVSAAMGSGDLARAEFLAYDPHFCECLHFSTVTFTTLGYGDYKPKPGWRWLADFEAVAGAALMAMFVVTLTRKYMR